MASRTRLEEAVARYQHGNHTFSELAEQTGLPIEQIMDAVTAEAGDTGHRQFLESCRAIAEAENDPEFYRLAEQAAQKATRQL